MKDLDFDKMKIGTYEPVKEKGKLKWDVKLNKTDGILCSRQEDAEIIFMLIKISKKLGIKL